MVGSQKKGRKKKKVLKEEGERIKYKGGKRMLSEKIERNEACCYLEIVVMVLTLLLPEKQGFYQFSNTSNLIKYYIKIKSYTIF